MSWPEAFVVVGVAFSAALAAVGIVCACAFESISTAENKAREVPKRPEPPFSQWKTKTVTTRVSDEKGVG